MSKFFVGQRVRILYSNCWPELAGSEGRIIGFEAPRAGIDDPHGEVGVAPDMWGSSLAPWPGLNGGSWFYPNTSQLEPILPEGSAPSEFTFQQLMDNLQEVMA